MKFYSTIFLILFICSCTQNKPSVSSNEKADIIDEFIGTCSSQGLFSGSILVAQNNKLIYRNSFGYSNKETKELNAIDTKFRIGSMTKQFTSMMVMQLVEEGRIKLDGKIKNYLNEYRDDTGNKITIHHLLSHQSGIIDYCNFEQFWSIHALNKNTDEFMLKEFHSNDLEFEPGTKVNYCNTGYCLLALIIERVTGKSYEENLRERITLPLQMKNTGIIKSGKNVPNTAEGYINSFLGFKTSFLELSNFIGAGNMYSTVDDLYIWDQALNTEQLLPKEYLEIMFTPNLDEYAYGWIVEDFIDKGDSLQHIYHQGHIDGFCSMISRIENSNTTIILLHNGGVTKVYDQSKEVQRILKNSTYSVLKTPIDIRLSKDIANYEEDDLLEKYLQLKKDSLEYYDFDTYYLHAYVSNLEAAGNSLLAKKVNRIIDYELRQKTVPINLFNRIVICGLLGLITNIKNDL